MVKQSKYFRLSVINQCNLSCSFCHNEGQNHNDHKYLSIESLLYICKIAKEEGFTKFKLTGGEPTIREDIYDLIEKLIEIGIEDLSMITNGTLLLEKAGLLKKAGLKRLNVTLNTLNYEKFKYLQGGTPECLDQIIKGIDYAIHVGFKDIKINYVFTGTDSEQELNEMIEFANNRELILVVLPVMKNDEDDKISLDYLYETFKQKGIKNEIHYKDDEGINKRIIELMSGAKVLLRMDELKEHYPYVFCHECETKAHCQEGIFPLRLTAAGTLIPCLASENYRINLLDAIQTLDESYIRESFRESRRWKYEK